MRRAVVVLLVLGMLSVAGCGKEHIDAGVLVERGGLYYLPNSTTPVSGAARGWHDNGQLKAEGTYKNGELVE